MTSTIHLKRIRGLFCHFQGLNCKPICPQKNAIFTHGLETLDSRGLSIPVLRLSQSWPRASVFECVCVCACTRARVCVFARRYETQCSVHKVACNMLRNLSDLFKVFISL